MRTCFLMPTPPTNSSAHAVRSILNIAAMLVMPPPVMPGLTPLSIMQAHQQWQQQQQQRQQQKQQQQQQQEQ